MFSQQYPSIQTAFKDGLETIYGTLFTDSLYLYLLDKAETIPNIYEEAPEKVYAEPIKLVGGVRLNVSISENPAIPATLVVKDAVIKIPTKQLIENNIPFTSEDDLKELRKGRFVYKKVEYLIDYIRPQTFVADMWQVYAFECSKAVPEKRL